LGQFYGQSTDIKFKGSLDDCRNNQVINNRLYGKSATNILPIVEKTDHPIYDDISLPKCITSKDSGNFKTRYINVMTNPSGLRLDKKCLREENLSKENTCLPN
jgi:hypothetical protein